MILEKQCHDSIADLKAGHAGANSGDHAGSVGHWYRALDHRERVYALVVSSGPEDYTGHVGTWESYDTEILDHRNENSVGAYLRNYIVAEVERCSVDW